MWWIKTSLFVSVITVFLRYRDVLDWNKTFFHRVTPGPCKYVIEDGGSEDMTHLGDGIVIMTSGLGAGLGNGNIKTLDVNTSEVITMQIDGAPLRDDFMTRPHGLSTWTDQKGQTFLYVITHPPSKDMIEVFKVKDNSRLQYKRTITDPLFRQLNDLVMDGKDRFYVATFSHYFSGFMQLFEILTRRPWGSVMFYVGTRARQVVSDLFMPNGINISKDKTTVYVAEFGNKNVLAYQRTTGNDLTKLWEKYSDTLVDNIEVDPVNGDLWIGCHPVYYRIYDYMLSYVGYSLPSQVLRYKMDDNHVSVIEEIYADDGSELYGSTVATYVMGKLVIGTVTRQTLVCDVNYLSE